MYLRSVAIAEPGHRQYAGLPGMAQSMAIAALGMTALGSGDLIAAQRHLDSARESFGDYGEVPDCSTDSGSFTPKCLPGSATATSPSRRWK
jgi:hypothetical protein